MGEDNTERLGEAQRLRYAGVEVAREGELCVARYTAGFVGRFVGRGATPAGALTLLAQDLASEIARMAQAQNAALAVALEEGL